MMNFKRELFLLLIVSVMSVSLLLYPEKACAEKGTVDNMGMRIGFLYAKGSLDVYGRKYDIPHYGLRIEYERGYEIRSLQGLEFVAAVSYLQIQAKDKFDADVDPTATTTFDTPLNFEPIIRGTIVMSRLRYFYRTSLINFGFELGFGAGIFDHHVYWDFKEIGDSDIERENSAKPVADWGLLFTFPLGENNNVGFHVRGVVIPMDMQIAGTGDYGPYKINVIGEFGISWNARF